MTHRSRYGTAGWVVAIAMVAAACGRETAPAAAPGAPIDVEVARVTMADLHLPFEAGGTVRARTTASIVSRIVAEIREVRVVPGDRVRAGQPLILLDDRDLEANRLRAEAGVAAAEASARAAAAGIAAAEAGLELATATHRRVAELADKKAATPQELDQAVAGLRAGEAQADAARAQQTQADRGLEAARAAADAARVMASYAVLTAPFAGVVTEKMVEPGNLASPGVPLMSVEDTREFRLEVRVDESRAALVSLGDTVALTLGGDAPADEKARPALSGTVSEIARALDPGAHAFLIKIAVPEHPAVRSGMYGRARFAGPPRRALAVPTAALVRRGQLVRVYVIDEEGRAHLRLVNVAGADGELAEVLAGLTDGETVVTDPPPMLTDGAQTSRRGAPAGDGGRR
jgi:RND family efflux transporter MFP subunit